MEKFEQVIKEAQEPITPSNTFVEETMQRITEKPNRHHWGLKLWLPVTASALAVAAVFVFHTPSSTSTPVRQLSSPTGPSQAAQAATTMASGTDNASLASDLATISDEINQGDSNLANANNAVNNQPQSITIPTN